jgi:hypothetical protein
MHSGAERYFGGGPQRLVAGDILTEADTAGMTKRSHRELAPPLLLCPGQTDYPR